MLFAVCLYSVIFLIQLLPKPSEAAYAGWTTDRQRGKIRRLVLEILKVVQMKVRSLRFIQRKHSQSTAWQRGESMYDIRRKFNRMMYLLESSEKEYRTQKTINMAEVLRLQTHIELIILMIEEEERRLKTAAQNSPVSKQSMLRMKDPNFLDSQKKRDALKGKMMRRGSGKLDTKKQKYLEDGFDTD